MGSALVTLPDGRRAKVTFDSPEQLDAAVNDLTGQAKPANAEPPVQAPQVPDTRPQGDLGQGVDEALASLGTGAIATPIAGLAGLGTMAGNAMGLTDRQPADVVRSVQGALTYQPRTKAGQDVTDAIAYPFEKLAEGADYVGGKTAEVTGSPALGAAVNTAIQSAPALLTRGRVSRDVPDPVRPSVPSREVAPPVEAPVVKRAAGLESVSKPVPTIEELGQLAKDAYKRADDAGVVLRAGSVGQLKSNIVAMTKKEGLNSKLHPDSAAALQEILKAKGNLKLSDVETLRKIANDAKGSIKPADKRIAANIVDEIDDYIERIDAPDVVQGDVTKVSALKEARGFYSRKMKAEEIQGLVERAELSAPNFSASGLENALRTEFRNLAKNGRKMRRFTPDERAAIQKVAKGGKVENALRFIGKFAPTGVVSGALSGGLGALLAGPAGVGVPLIGMGGRALATRMTKKNVAAADEMMRRGPGKPSTTDRLRKMVDEPLKY